MSSHRFRERTSDDPAVSYLLERDAYTGSCGETTENLRQVLFEGSFVPKTFYESMQDVVTPRFTELSAKGHIINSPMTSVKRTNTENMFTQYVDYSYGYMAQCDPVPADKTWIDVQLLDYGTRPSSHILSGDYGLPDIPSNKLDTDFISTMRTQAVSKAWASATLNEAEVLVQIGESEKTVASLVSIFKRFIKIIKILKTGKLWKLKLEFTPKELADRYMELRYALRPLLYDLVGNIAALNHEAGELNDRLTFRSFVLESENSEDVSTVTHQTVTNSVATWKKLYELTRLADRKVEVRAGVLTELETLSKLPVWGFANPVEAVWELVPFSFIVDWFFTVGDTIAAWTPLYGLKQLASWVVTTDTVVRSSQITDSWTDNTHLGNVERRINAHDFTIKGCGIGEILVTKTRVPDPSRYTFPTFNVRLDMFKLTDLLIIAKGIFFSR